MLVLSILNCMMMINNPMCYLSKTWLLLLSLDKLSTEHNRCVEIDVGVDEDGTQCRVGNLNGYVLRLKSKF